jgi:hypothetical protein
MGCALQWQRVQARHNLRRGKDAFGLEALARSHFPTPRRLMFPHRSLHRSSKDERTVTTACLKPGPENGFNDRPTLKDRHARNSSWPGEIISTQRPYTFAQTCLSTKLPFAVLRRTIHFRGNAGWIDRRKSVCNASRPFDAYILLNECQDLSAIF